MKNIKLPKVNLVKKKINWQKSIFITLLLCIGVYIILLGYLFIKPISSEVQEIIKDELTTSDINFDQKTLDSLKKRQQPSTPSQAPIGKNPFLPF